MNILLVAATPLEIQPVAEFLAKRFKQLGGDIFFNDQHRVQVLVTGVGMVATTFALTRQLSEKSYDVVLQTGIGGSFDRGIKLGSVCFVISEVFGDMGAEDHYNFIDVFELELEGKDTPPFQNGALVNPMTGIPFQSDLPQVSALTVNSVSGSDFTAESRQKKYNCQLESMEGAAFHYVCLQKGVPFAQVRAISNYVEARDKSQWQLKEAVVALNSWLIQLLS